MLTCFFRLAICFALSLAVEVTQLSAADADVPAVNPVDKLVDLLKKSPETREDIQQQDFSTLPLTKEQAEDVKKALVADRVQLIKSDRAQEMKDKVIKLGELSMKFEYFTYGKKPMNGRSLFISMHGGGGAPPQVNDQQWQNQKKLYKPEEGIYLVPRAATDTWDLWHQSHIDQFFTRLIENMIVLEDVDPDRVYILGYSAGGDGVYQLAPRMADQLAAAAMMAGHPNETEPAGLRNLPFILQMGGKDGAYDRNRHAKEFGAKLAALAEKDEGAYPHLVKIYPEHAHWMNLDDKIALPWMAKYNRVTHPTKVVWRQDDVLHDRFYWLRVKLEEAKAGQEIVASRDGNRFSVEQIPENLTELTLMLDDSFCQLDEPVVVSLPGGKEWTGTPIRNIATINKTLSERGDPNAVYSAELVIPLQDLK
ncbi:dienelactone hydrolase family protein [Planctomicrobium sp. SH668]|uniref:dienelactone hydrolase family protein n=1 Tax=Planctomicrobium sp. SH668 TaxID=3448126 RepID=UPI003F5C2595